MDIFFGFVQVFLLLVFWATIGSLLVSVMLDALRIKGFPDEYLEYYALILALSGGTYILLSLTYG